VSNKKVSVVVTTVNVPKVLQVLEHNYSRYGHDNVSYVIVGDQRTPDHRVDQMIATLSTPTLFLSYGDQEQFYRDVLDVDYDRYSKIFPSGSDGMRALGYLAAVKQFDPDVIITLDDDNFPYYQEDFIGEHCITGGTATLLSVASGVKWINTSRFIKHNYRDEIFSRGYPWYLRSESIYVYRVEYKRVVLNAGLWSLAPDVDAVTRLSYEGLRAERFKPFHFMVQTGNMLPIPTQNTSFIPDILPCYYYFYMGYPIHNLRIGRIGDIWTGVFCKKVVDAMVDDRVCFGSPQAEHFRNAHVVEGDLAREYWGNLMSKMYYDAVQGIQLEGGDYYECSRELNSKLRGEMYSHVDTQFRSYFLFNCECVDLWLDLLEEVDLV